MLFVSKYFQSIPYDDESAIIWHSIFGRPMLVSNELATALKKGVAIDVKKIFGSTYKKSSAVKKAVNTLTSAHILIGSEQLEEMEIKRLFFKHNKIGENKVKSLSLIMSEECPFRCKYCIHFANSEHYYNPEKFMSEEVAKISIDNYMSIVLSDGIDEAYINFGGGEPLLNWPVIRRLLPYIDGYRQKYSQKIRTSINTNLSLLTPEIAKDLIKYNVEIAASLDGTQKGNDAVRLTKDLKGTYDSIVRGFQILRDQGRPLDGFAMTVIEDNFFDVDTPIIDWAASLGMTEVRIDIDVVGVVNIPVDEIVKRLIEVRQYAKTKGISIIGFWSRAAENLGLIPEDEDIGFCGGERGNSLCVAPSGQVFPCGYSNYELGRYDNIIDIHRGYPYFKLLEKRNLDKLDHCQTCPILGFCRGGCMITHEAGGGFEKLSRMCELYTKMTYAILRESVEV